MTTEFIYCFLSHYPIVPHVTGVAQPKLSQRNLNRIEMTIPSAQLSSMFQVVVEPLAQQIFKLRAGNDQLAQVRDLLLPRLMTGEVKV